MEKYILRWRKGKWAFRVSNLITGAAEKELLLEQLDLLQEKWKSLAVHRKRTKGNLEIVAKALHLAESSSYRDVLSKESQISLEKHIASLRWEGRVDEAKLVRDAWRQIQSECEKEHGNLLERLCCLYGLIKNNAFCSAFTNIIERDESTGKIVLNKSNIYEETAKLLVSNIPFMDIFYAFLGYQPRSIANEGGGYGEAIGKYLAINLACKYENQAGVYQKFPEPPGRSMANESVLFDAPAETLFYSNLNGDNHWPNSNTPRYLHFRKVNDTSTNGDSVQQSTTGEAYPKANASDTYIATLILIASENPHERRVQIPEKKERDGIARRLAFVVGVPPDNVGLRVLFLPPAYLDGLSAERFVEVLDGKVWAPEFQCFHGYYARELEGADIDFAEQRKKLPQEDWREL